MAQPTPGILSQISFKKETTWGTAVVPDKSIKVKPTNGIATDNNVKLLNALEATLAKNFDSIIGARKHTGSYSMDLFSDYPGYFIYGAMGGISDATAGGETIVYNHTITESATKPSFTIEQAFGDNTQRFAGALCDTWKITSNQGDTVTFDASFMGKSQASATKISAAYTNIRPFNFVDVIVKIGGVTYTEFTNFEMEYKANIEMIYALSGNDPQFFVPKGSEVSGKLTLVLDTTSLTEFTNYLNGTKRSLEFIATQADSTIGSTSHYKYDITVPKAVYMTSPIKLTDSYCVLEINWSAVYDTGTTSLLSAVITNLMTAYS